MVPVLLVPKSLFRHCYYCFPPTARACPVVAFSTVPRRRRSPFVTTTDSNGGWYKYHQDDNDAILCQQRRWIHAASPMLLLASSSSSSTSSSATTTTNSTNSTTPTTTNNNNEKETIPSTINLSTVKKNDEAPLPIVLQETAVLPRSTSSWSRRLRKGLGDVFSTVGFLSSSLSSLVRDPFQVWDQTQEPLQAFRNFLQTSGIDKELNQALSTSALSMALLFRVHSSSLIPNKNQHQQQGQQQQEQYNTEGDRLDDDTLDATFWTRAKRYMRFATAVYGRAMIRAATVHAYGNFKDLAESVGQETLQTISNHVQVPVQDLIWVEVDYDYDNDNDKNTDHDDTTTTTTATDNNKATTTTNNKDHYLRHLVAVDLTHQEVVLAIRGTFSIQEIVVDLTSFSREGFVGGEAHEGMATMAERLWQVAGPVIVQTLQQHPDYRLVVTGHSLGAGTASLLTILLKQQQQQQRWGQASSSSLSASSVPMIPPTTNVQCFAYASPPVFTPLDLIPHVTPAITNFIHERDVVPFLSVYSVRHLLASLKAIQSVPLSLTEKLAIIAGSQPPPPELLAAVQNVPSIVPIRGAPRLHVPASKTIWLHSHTPSPTIKRTSTSSQDDASTTSSTSATTTYSVCKTLPFEIRVHPNMLVDHFPARYEYALEHLPIKK